MPQSISSNEDVFGYRLKEAREALGLYQNNLADLVGVSRTALNNYEAGRSQPSDEDFIKLCKILQQPPAFFHDQNFEFEFAYEDVHFRDLKSNAMYLRNQAGVRLKWMMEYYRFLQSELSLPEPNLPDLNPPDDPSLITDEFVEEAAIKVRELWGLSDAPIKNLIYVMELNGCVIGKTSLDLPKLDGLSYWSERQNRPFILLNADKASRVRSRFDAAHELGHMLLHRNVNRDFSRGTPVYNRMEKQAHAFASALLLPKTSWLRELKTYIQKRYTLAPFKTLKPKWITSIKAQIMRLDNLGIIDERRRKSLFTQHSNRNWTTREPFDDLWELEEVKLFSQATRMLIENKNAPIHIEHIFPRRAEHLSEITGLSEDYFKQDSLPITRDAGMLN